MLETSDLYQEKATIISNIFKKMSIRSSRETNAIENAVQQDNYIENIPPENEVNGAVELEVTDDDIEELLVMGVPFGPSQYLNRNELKQEERAPDNENVQNQNMDPNGIADNSTRGLKRPITIDIQEVITPKQLRVTPAKRLTRLGRIIRDKQLKGMTRDDLEMFCVLKITECITQRSEIADRAFEMKKMNQLLAQLHAENKSLIQMLAMYTKQHQTIMQDIGKIKAGNKVTLSISKNVRTVGTQVSERGIARMKHNVVEQAEIVQLPSVRVRESEYVPVRMKTTQRPIIATTNSMLRSVSKQKQSNSIKLRENTKPQSLLVREKKRESESNETQMTYSPRNLRTEATTKQSERNTRSGSIAERKSVSDELRMTTTKSSKRNSRLRSVKCLCENTESRSLPSQESASVGENTKSPSNVAQAHNSVASQKNAAPIKSRRNTRAASVAKRESVLDEAEMTNSPPEPATNHPTNPQTETTTKQSKRNTRSSSIAERKSVSDELRMTTTKPSQRNLRLRSVKCAENTESRSLPSQKSTSVVENTKSSSIVAQAHKSITSQKNAAPIKSRRNTRALSVAERESVVDELKMTNGLPEPVTNTKMLPVAENAFATQKDKPTRRVTRSHTVSERLFVETGSMKTTENSKLPAVAKQAFVTAVAPVPVKRKRGRPRKNLIKIKLLFPKQNKGSTIPVSRLESAVLPTETNSVTALKETRPIELENDPKIISCQKKGIQDNDPQTVVQITQGI